MQVFNVEESHSSCLKCESYAVSEPSQHEFLLWEQEELGVQIPNGGAPAHANPSTRVTSLDQIVFMLNIPDLPTRI